MRIQVTQGDIDRGTINDAMSCPVALAIRRQCNVKQDGVCVDYGGIFLVLEPPFEIPLKLPVGVEDFMQSFDDNQNVQPFEFELDIPS